MNALHEPVRIGDLFTVKSGDFHATQDLDAGTTPLISCGNINNGLVGYYDVPEDSIYHDSITVAYNGQPLTVKYHPYRFAAKDDVAVLIPKKPMQIETLLFFAAYLNRAKWRYSYGRKCFKKKLENFSVRVPIKMWKVQCSVRGILPKKNSKTMNVSAKYNWKNKKLTDIFDIGRGDFHSITNLDIGKVPTVSRMTEDNGLVGYFAPPEGAEIYKKGTITISTVGGDAFVQLQDFLATDNVVLCNPKKAMRPTTLFFFSFLLNRQRWRYSYGRQCYKTKLAQTILPIPVNSQDEIDEDNIQKIVEGTTYWPTILSQYVS